MNKIKIDIRIMASPKRRSHVLKMLEELHLDESVVAWDDRPNGGSPMYTSRKAWLSPIPEGTTHRLVLQDDVEMVNHFSDILQIAAGNFPKAIWSLYEGQASISGFDDKKKSSPYIRIKGCCCYGVALMMPVEYIRPCFDWIETELGIDYKHDDCGIGLFSVINGMTVFSTIPSLVQHIAPTKSLMQGHSRANKVSAVYEGKDIFDKYDWNDKDYSVSKLTVNQTWLDSKDPTHIKIRAMIKSAVKI